MMVKERGSYTDKPIEVPPFEMLERLLLGRKQQ
jgi:hypothetical protein